MASTVTLSRGGLMVRQISLDDGEVILGRKDAILKRKCQESDVGIPRRAARLDVDAAHPGTLVLTNIHEKADLQMQLPDDQGTVCLRAQQEMAIPSGIVMWGVKLSYTLPEPSIWSQDTEDDDATVDDEVGGESQPLDDWMQGAQTQL